MAAQNESYSTVMSCLLVVQVSGEGGWLAGQNRLSYCFHYSSLQSSEEAVWIDLNHSSSYGVLRWDDAPRQRNYSLICPYKWCYSQWSFISPKAEELYGELPMISLMKRSRQNSCINKTENPQISCSLEWLGFHYRSLPHTQNELSLAYCRLVYSHRMLLMA